MNPKIKFKKGSFLSYYLLPISKVADNISLVPQDNSVYTICSSQAGGSVVLYSQYKSPIDLDVNTRINIPDVKKFIRLLDCIEKDEIELELHSNHLRYKDNSFKFNYFLLEDGVMPRCPVNPEKIKKLEFDCTFTLTSSKLQDILTGSSIATESNKVYLFTKDGNVYAELNDFERQNVNNICYQAAEQYEGKEISSPIALGLEGVRLLSGIRVSGFKVGVNIDLKIVCLEYSDDVTDVKFIISGLVK